MATPLGEPGPALRQARVAAGVTLRELAAQVNVTPGHLARIESGSRRPSGRIADAYAALGAELREEAGTTAQRRSSVTVISERLEIHLLDNGDCDHYDHLLEVVVAGSRTRRWTLDEGPRRVVAEYAYEVLDGPDLVYDDTRHTTSIHIPLAPGLRQVGVRVYPPPDLNILTVEATPASRSGVLEFSIFVPRGLIDRLDLRRIQAIPPDGLVVGEFPLRYQSPVRVCPVTRVGFDTFLLGHMYGVAWQLPEWLKSEH